MTPQSPVLVLSHHIATTYADQITAAAPGAKIVCHHPDGRWEGDPYTGTVVYLSSDMWPTPMAREALRGLSAWPLLRWVHTSSAGVDHPAFGRLLERGVTLTNASGVNSVPIAQHVLALMLAHARRLHEYRDVQAQRRWQRLECQELTGATALIVGLGGIGSRVALLCRAFDMHVVGVRRSGAPAAGVDRLIAPEELRTVLPEADYLVLACPLTEATRGLIDADALARMKPSAFLVNVARGPIVDAAALNKALRDGRLGGAALDVFDREPLAPESPLWDAPNLVITPHTAGSSPFNPRRNAGFFLDNLARYCRGEPLVNIVRSVDG